MRKLIFILSVIALAACGGNDDAVTIPSVDPSPTPRLLTVEVGENPIQDENADAPQLATRTAAATTTATLSSFSMNYENNKYDFSKSGDTWTPTTIDWPVPGDDTKIDFYAYSDGSFIYNGGNPYVSFTMDENAFHQKDFLIAAHKQIPYSDADGKVSLTFDHACASVRFQICQTQTVAGQGHAFNIKSVVLKNVIKKGDYYYDSGWTLGSGSTDLTLTNTDISLTTDYQLLPSQWLFLIPQSKADVRLEIKYTIDGGAEKTKEINVGTGSWEQGKQYSVNIRVGSSFLI